jgi:hypothetical protein
MDIAELQLLKGFEPARRRHISRGLFCAMLIRVSELSYYWHQMVIDPL